MASCGESIGAPDTCINCEAERRRKETPETDRLSDRLDKREAAYTRLREDMEPFIKNVLAGKAVFGEEVEVLPRMIELCMDLFR
jgi:hypothetical protein